MENDIKNHILTIFLNNTNKMLNEKEKCKHHYEAMQSLEREFKKYGVIFHTDDYEPDNSFAYRFVSQGHILIINLLDDLGYLIFIPEEYNEEQRKIISNCRELLSYTDVYYFQKKDDAFVEANINDFIITSLTKKKNYIKK